MAFLNKLLLFLYLPFLLLSTSPVTTKCDDFEKKVNDYYHSYVLETYETNNYTFKVVEGVCNDKLSYGVFLACVEANTYDLKIMVNGVEYTVKEDNRGDYIAYVIVRTNDEISICVFDNANGNSTKRYEYQLAYYSKEDIEMSTTCVKGNNLACKEISKLKKNYQIDTDIIIVLIVLSAISLMCIVWILALLVFKKGLFNKNIKRESEVIFFNFNEEQDDDLDNIEVEALEIKDKEPKEVYEKKYYYEEETEEISDEEFDFKPYLEEKGYQFDYSLMSEEEKNQVMVLLMTLKYNGTINEFQYKNEVIKLWKK